VNQKTKTNKSSPGRKPNPAGTKPVKYGKPSDTEGEMQILQIPEEIPWCQKYSLAGLNIGVSRAQWCRETLRGLATGKLKVKMPQPTPTQKATNGRPRKLNGDLLNIQYLEEVGICRKLSEMAIKAGFASRAEYTRQVLRACVK
jgi:hypothetical protein